jgi:phage recombination protein Bet
LKKTTTNDGVFGPSKPLYKKQIKGANTMTIEVRKDGPYSPEKIALIRNTVCKGAGPEEFELFLHACNRTGLDPFMRQIYAVFRNEKKPNGSWGKAMTIQTGIDGYRLIAERTRNYAPGKETVYQYDAQGMLVSATAYVRKRTEDGTWHDVSATAFYDEYVQTTKDKDTGNETPTRFWFKMRHTMLAKCAESLALRKCFPAELSGVYTHEEMKQADSDKEIISIQEVLADFQPKIDQVLAKMMPCDKEDAAKCIESYKKSYTDLNPLTWHQVFERFLEKCIANPDKFYEQVLVDWQSKNVTAKAG